MSANRASLKIPQMLMIAGQQQNVGKTTLACRIIARFSREFKITAFKVTPHFHSNIGNAEILKSGNSWQLIKETDPNSTKDTSLMLKSGAEDAYLLQANEKSLLVGFQELMKFVPAGNMIVCESAGLRQYINPGVLLFLRQLSCRVCSVDDEKMIQSADRLITFTTNGFDFSLSDLEISDNAWIINYLGA